MPQLSNIKQVRDDVLSQIGPAAAVLANAPTDPRDWALSADQLTQGTLGWIRTSKGLGPSKAMALLPTLLASFSALSFTDIPRSAVGHFARSLATAVMLPAVEGWNTGRVLRDQLSISPTLPRRLTELETRAHAVLRHLWRAARHGDSRALTTIMAELEILTAALPRLCVDAASAPLAAQLSSMSPGLRATRLVRELALWTAAIPLLAVRLSDDRLRASTQKLAARRTQLRRHDGPPGRALLKVPPLPTGRNATVIGVIEETGWVERPGNPYGWALLQNDEILVLPHKRFRTRGAAPDAVVWASGRVKASFAELGRVLEIEAEGPSQHAGTVWADWLADELRGALDIAPGSLRLWWEMPDPRSDWANRDISSHLPHQQVTV
ncbi:MAG: hypothetical protein JKY93_10035 [Gammaproteobacteria bacterium]|nr:hypothetical protein [Gammaproteobacteria bacterium]